MRFLTLIVVMGLSMSAVAQPAQKETTQTQKMNPRMHLSLNSEVMRSPVYTKQAYRQAKRLDQAVDKKQEEYLKKKKDEEKLTDEELAQEKEHLAKIRLVDYGMSDVNLKKKSAEITKNPAQSFYNLSINAKAGNQIEIAKETEKREKERLEQEAREHGLTVDEYQAALAKESARSKGLGNKTISIRDASFK